jgi:hypothetical protein
MRDIVYWQLYNNKFILTKQPIEKQIVPEKNMYIYQINNSNNVRKSLENATMSFPFI